MKILTLLVPTFATPLVDFLERETMNLRIVGWVIADYDLCAKGHAVNVVIYDEQTCEQYESCRECVTGSVIDEVGQIFAHALANV